VDTAKLPTFFLELLRSAAWIGVRDVGNALDEIEPIDAARRARIDNFRIDIARKIIAKLPAPFRRCNRRKSIGADIVLARPVHVGLWVQLSRDYLQATAWSISLLQIVKRRGQPSAHLPRTTAPKSCVGALRRFALRGSAEYRGKSLLTTSMNQLRRLIFGLLSEFHVQGKRRAGYLRLI
jgi:hypothetical protein